MAEIPTGAFDAERIAGELYDKAERESFFKAAYERFPSYNDDPYDAAEYIQDRFGDEFSDLYSDEEWEKVSEALFEHIMAGLT